jgi:hypothetical protein
MAFTIFLDANKFENTPFYAYDPFLSANACLVQVISGTLILYKTFL